MRTTTFVVVRPLSNFSRMLDLGGSPSMKNDDGEPSRVVNASKNCKVQAVCFDFDVLTRSIDQQRDNADEQQQQQPLERERQEQQTLSSGKIFEEVKPDANAVENVASLLNVTLGGTIRTSRLHSRQDEDDDLSLLTGGYASSTSPPRGVGSSGDPVDAAVAGSATTDDIRSKYADKLRKKGVRGGIAGVELARSEGEESLSRGDAAGHWAARVHVTKTSDAAAIGSGGGGSSGSRWMVMTGTGNLLQYLSQRSIKIALLPLPDNNGVDSKEEEEGERMESLTRQLKDVVFDLLLKVDGTRCRRGTAASTLIRDCFEELSLERPELAVVVSDRDDYIKAAKDMGMVTVRIRPPNTRRGNISAHYNVPTVPEVRDVINQINGISFNAVLKGR